MATLYFGGSFNPIHHGHLICSRVIAEARGFERVALVPSSQPPHKQNAVNMAGSVGRMAMCRLASAGDPQFEVSDLELARTGPSYTIDSVRELSRGGAEKVSWLIGADMLMFLPYWHRPQDLLAEVNFIVMARPGWKLDWSALPAPFQKLQQNVVEAPLIDITGTQIRDRVARGLSISYLTPPAVCNYIAEHRLYRSGAGE